MNAPFQLAADVAGYRPAERPWPPWPWLCIAVLAAFEGAWLLVTPLRLAPNTLALVPALGAIAAVSLWASRLLAGRPRLYSLCVGGAFLAVAWPALRLLNHLTMTIALPLADARLAGWDKAIGFDWLSYVLLIDSHPLLLDMMRESYSGLTGYSCVIFVLLAFGRDPRRRCFEMIALFLITALVCTIAGMFFPARAAMAYYAPDQALFDNISAATGTYHLAALEQLRAASAHSFDLGDMPGLVTFPSFHTAMGLIAIYCSRGTLWLLPPSLAVNALMIASTPVLGSHYAIDVLAGAAVAAAAILAMRWFERRRPQPE